MTADLPSWLLTGPFVELPLAKRRNIVVVETLLHNNGTVTAAAAALPGSAPSGDPPPRDAILRPAVLLALAMSSAR